MANERYQSRGVTQVRRCVGGFLRVGATMAAALAVVAVAPRVAAQGPVVTPAPLIEVRYRAPGGCPDELAFRSELDRRLGDAARPSTVLDVELSTKDERTSGVLLRDGQLQRRLVGDTCEEVVKALALVAALAILPPETAPQTPSSGAPPVAPTAVPRRAPLAPPPDASPPRGALFVGASGGLDSYTAPGLTLFGALAVEARFPGPETGPSVRLGAALSQTREATTGRFRTGFSRIGGRADLCPLGLPVGPLRLRPCAGLAIDQIRGDTDGIPEPRAARTTVVSGQLAARLLYPLGPLALGLHAGLAVPFGRPRFILESPEVEVHRVPFAAFVGGLEVDVRVF